MFVLVVITSFITAGGGGNYSKSYTNKQIVFQEFNSELSCLDAAKYLISQDFLLTACRKK